MPDKQNTPEPPKENEIADYFEGVKKLELEGYETGIKKARNALFITAGLVLLAEVISLATSGIPLSPFLIGFIVVEVGIFVALGFWTKTQPLTAIIIGLLAFLGLWIFTIVATDSSAIYK